jgi:phage terminase small subunit
MPDTPDIRVPVDNACGPAMLKLSINQRAFVIAWLELGGTHGKASEAARIAGYTTTGGATRARAYSLMHNPRVLEAIKEEAEKRIQSGVALGASVLVEIASDPVHKDRFKAATALLDRGGLQLAMVNKHLHIVEDNRTDAEIERIIAEMAAKQGLDPKKLLGNSAKVVDAEFSEVEPLGEFDVPAETNG